MTSPELLPCPFCGSKPNPISRDGGSDERNGYNFTVRISCQCGASIRTESHRGPQGWCDDKGQAEREAIAAWNRRALKPPTSAEAKEIERLLEVLREIGDFAHDKSTGPEVPDALWEVRHMAYESLSASTHKE